LEKASGSGTPPHSHEIRADTTRPARWRAPFPPSARRCTRAHRLAFLADGEIEIAQTTDGPPGIGTVYASTVKDAGLKSQRVYKLSDFEAPTRIGWTELSNNVLRGMRVDAGPLDGRIRASYVDRDIRG
jgi:hypothetical protein